ncbi:DpnI domain-containing protein [Chloroflexota bacterium]
MNLFFETQLADDYKSPSQKVRVLTEHWVDNQVYCPNCGHSNIDRYENNKPVADFFCPHCKEDYELKSKKVAIGDKIVDGAYHTMIERLHSSNNPSLFLLSYDLQNFEVLNFLVIPKHFFIPEIIEERKPLAPTARRAGWVGCNILLQGIPQTGKIFFVKNHQPEPKGKVLAEWKKTLFLREEKETSAKGWLLDVMNCIESLGNKEVSLDEVYSFVDMLGKRHPENKHIKDKIRQQLQILRDKGYLEFIERGRYRLV